MPLENDLAKELQTYRRELPELLRGHEGEFVLIHGDQVDSFRPNENAAYEAGCERLGLEPFLVKQVLRTEPVLESSVDVLP